MSAELFTLDNPESVLFPMLRNLAFCMNIQADQLVATLYGGCTDDEWGRRTKRLAAVLVAASDQAKRYIGFVHAINGNTIASILPVPADVSDAPQPQPHQMMLSHVLDRARDQNLRRFKTAFYAPRMLEGVFTRFFEYSNELSTFMYQACTPHHLNMEAFHALTLRPATPRQISGLLENLPDARAPFLKKDRAQFSFKNGVLDVRNCRLYTYIPTLLMTSTERHVSELPVDSSSANFVNSYLNPAFLEKDFNFMDIPTEAFDKLLQAQGYGDKAHGDMMYWILVMGGRLLHDVATMDDWQLCLFFRGVAGSGKSTILKLFSEIYQMVDIGMLMSDGQATFSDEHLVNAFIVLAMDVDASTNFSLTRFNSFVSGENVSINCKFKTAMMMKWRAGIAMASNSQPPFRDVGGNCSRRFFIILFNQPIEKSDSTLFTRCKKNLGNILLKMALAYRHALATHATGSLWDGQLPKEILAAKQSYLGSCSALAAFLTSDSVSFDMESEVTVRDFERTLNSWASMTLATGGRSGRGNITISAATDAPVLKLYKCRLLESPTKRVIMGLRLIKVAQKEDAGTGLNERSARTATNVD